MRRVWVYLCVAIASGVLGGGSVTSAAEGEAQSVIRGTVQNQDLRRVGQAVVEVKDQEGNTVTSAVSNDAGEFVAAVPAAGTYSVSAVQDTYRSEYVVLKVETEELRPVTLTLSKTREVALEVVSPLAPSQRGPKPMPTWRASPSARTSTVTS